jgi:eukaryotic-like serine/threonine-protein kinase
VFALGIVAYELYTVRRLFKGTSDFLTMSAIVQGNIPKPSTYRPDIPPALEAIIMKALAMAPDQRYATAEEMRKALQQFAAEHKIQTSTAELADYMVKEFGHRPEPWLVEDDDAEIEVVDVDFDGAADGMAPIPTRTPGVGHFTPPPGSLLARARRKVAAAIGVPVMQAPVATPAPSAGFEKADGAPATGSGTPMAWTPAAPLAAPMPGKRRTRLLAAAIAAPVAIVAIVFATRGGGGDASAKIAPVAPAAAAAPAPAAELAPPTPTPPAPEPSPPPAAASAVAAPAPPPVAKPQIATKKAKPAQPTAKKPKPAYDPHSLFIKK